MAIELKESKHKWMNCYYCWSICQDESYCDFTIQGKMLHESGLPIKYIPKPKRHICQEWKLRRRGILPDIPFQPICPKCKESRWIIKLDRYKATLGCEGCKDLEIDIENFRTI